MGDPRYDAANPTAAPAEPFVEVNQAGPGATGRDVDLMHLKVASNDQVKLPDPTGAGGIRNWVLNCTIGGAKAQIYYNANAKGDHGHDPRPILEMNGTKRPLTKDEIPEFLTGLAANEKQAPYVWGIINENWNDVPKDVQKALQEKAASPNLPPQGKPVAGQDGPAIPKPGEGGKVDMSKVFQGQFFSVKPPDGFKVEKGTPDSVLVRSPKGDVGFYVYSPQWGGDAPDFVPRKGVTTEVTHPNRYTTETRATWKEPKTGMMRSMLRQEIVRNDEVKAVKVFGYEYRNKAAYDRHLDEYKAFKKSLQQFGD